MKNTKTSVIKKIFKSVFAFTLTLMLLLASVTVGGDINLTGAVWEDGEWKTECPECGELLTSEQKCPTCGQCNANGEYGCFMDWHCFNCGACSIDADAIDYCVDCHLCHNCWTRKHHCQSCMSHVEDLCEYCFAYERRICMNCHEEQWQLCVECGQCLAWDDDHCCKSDRGADHCSEECVLCKSCGECFYNNMDEFCSACEKCNECCYNEEIHCQGCGECFQEKDRCVEFWPWCEPCCEEIFHCENCGEHVGGDTSGWCEKGLLGTHCADCYQDNCCELCNKCFLCDGGEECPDCGLCLECCLEISEDEGCQCGLCVESSEFKAEDHLCSQCGAFSCVEGDFCSECSLCDTCCEENTADKGCDCGTCVQDSWFEDEEHICQSCGAFSCVVGEFCLDCMLCVDCCEENSASKGCDHGVCVESWEWDEHYCEKHECCFDYCEDEPIPHTHTYKNDGKYCDICHIGKDGDTLIYSQPRDFHCNVSNVNQDCEDNMATFRVRAYVNYKTDEKGNYVVDENGNYFKEDNNTYQWYMERPWAATDKALEDDIDGHVMYITGAQTSTLSLWIPSDACYETYKYYCVVTSPDGKTNRSKSAKIDADHVFEWSPWDLEADARSDHYHFLNCVGEGCSETKGKEEHRFGISAIITAATQYTKGKIMEQCVICDHKTYRETDALGIHDIHDFKLMSNTKVHWSQCTCAQYGMPKNLHVFKKIVTKEPTENAKGSAVYQCLECTYQYTKSIEKLPHKHVYWDGTYPMLAKYGVQVKDCYEINETGHKLKCIVKLSGKQCGYVDRRTERHDFDEWHDYHYPSMTGDGSMSAQCASCDYIKTAKLKKGLTVAVGENRAVTSVHSVTKGDKIVVTYNRSLPGKRLDHFTVKYYNFSDNVTKTSNLYPKKSGDISAEFTVDKQWSDGCAGIVFEAVTTDCDHTYGTYAGEPAEASCVFDGHEPDTLCKACNFVTKAGKVIKGVHVTELVKVSAPTCYEEGYTGDEQCTVCDTLVKKGEPIDKLTHVPVLTKQKAPTCGEGGYSGDYVCSLCSKIMSYGKTLKPTGKHKMTMLEQRDATCVQTGVKKSFFRCSDCGFSYRKSDGTGRLAKLEAYETDIDNSVHKNVTRVAKVEPTCSSKGRQPYYRCEDCYLAFLGYNADGTIFRILTGNPDSLLAIDADPDAHTWDGGVVTKAATVSEEGVKTFTCTGCGATKTESIPKLSGGDASSPSGRSALNNGSAKETADGVTVKKGTSAGALAASSADVSSVLGPDSSPLDAGREIGSGCTVVMSNGDKLTVVVKGDNDSDGKITAGDARMALRFAVSLDAPSAWQIRASMLTGADKVTAADARLILRAAVGLENADAWFAA